MKFTIKLGKFEAEFGLNKVKAEEMELNFETEKGEAVEIARMLEDFKNSFNK
ncbi:MAG: hypothetical protein ACRCZ9_01780 [Fusobacteriaceae bacterium]